MGKRMEIFDKTWPSPVATRRYRVLLFGDAEYGNPNEKSLVGQDSLTDCLEELGVEPDTLNAVLQEVEICGRADVTI